MAKHLKSKPRAATGTSPSEGRSVQTPTATGTSGLPHLPSEYPMFVFKSHPNRWQLMGEELLPVLGCIRLVPGQNCVTQEGDWSMTKARAEAEGWTVIPYEAIEGGYVREHDSDRKDDKGQALHLYMDRWQKPYAVAGRPEIRRDENGYREFLRALIQGGLIQLPTPEFLDKFSDRVKQRLVDLAAAGINKPAQEDAANNTLKAIDKMREDIESNPGVYESYAGPKISISSDGRSTVVTPPAGGAPE